MVDTSIIMQAARTPDVNLPNILQRSAESAAAIEGLPLLRRQQEAKTQMAEQSAAQQQAQMQRQEQQMQQSAPQQAPLAATSRAPMDIVSQPAVESTMIVNTNRNGTSVPVTKLTSAIGAAIKSIEFPVVIQPRASASTGAKIVTRIRLRCSQSVTDHFMRPLRVNSQLAKRKTSWEVRQ